MNRLRGCIVLNFSIESLIEEEGITGEDAEALRELLGGTVVDEDDGAVDQQDPCSRPGQVVTRQRVRIRKGSQSVKRENEYDFNCLVQVVRLEGNRFRSTSPAFLTMFGPFAPVFHLGDEFEAYPLGGRSYAYWRKVKRGTAWSKRVSPVPKEALSERDVEDALGRLCEEGGGWAWAIGHLLIELPCADSFDILPLWLAEVVGTIEGAVISRPR